MFVVALSRSLAPSSIKVYLAAIGSLHRQHGYKDPAHHNPRLKMVLQSTKRAHAMTTPTARQPITAQVLARLLGQVKHTKSLCGHDKRMLSAAFSLAFFGLLRISQFTVPTEKSFNHQSTQPGTASTWARAISSFTSENPKLTSFARDSVRSSNGQVAPFAQ